MEALIQIRAGSKHNILTSLLLGVFGLIAAVIVAAWLPEQFYLFSIFLTGASLVALLISWFKFREPMHSVELSRTTIRYLHRHGQWQVAWENIHRIDVPTVQKGLGQKKLAMVGIKIKDYRPFLADISPRLMSNILMEQRPLLLHSTGLERISDNSYGDSLLEDDRYKTEDGKVLYGIQAMFANRMGKLRQGLGYDLFISVADLDRSEQDFVTLLKECQAQVARSN
ncbi:MAG: hypothetical protein ACI965_001963 [Paraglaciecola sp.]|jgi:hypothetical protein